uniref:Uncharacterized protein n=1 Tax=Arundo donax TaxID=35708 RepID=A0A0A8ZRK5_ARUDO
MNNKERGFYNLDSSNIINYVRIGQRTE